MAQGFEHQIDWGNVRVEEIKEEDFLKRLESTASPIIEARGFCTKYEWPGLVLYKIQESDGQKTYLIQEAK